MAELVEIIPEGWSGTLILLLVALTIGPWAIFSKDHSDKWWALGRITRWIRNREIREIEDTSKLADATIAGHVADRERWLSQMQDLRAEMNADRSRFREEMDDLAEQARDYWAFIVYTAQRRRELDLMAVRYGWEPPLPEWPTFDQWKKDRTD